MLIPIEEGSMTAVIGPDFIALQVKDLRRSQSFYLDQLGLRAASFSPPGAVVFDTRPIPFAVREPLVDLSASPRLGWGVSLWLAADDAQGLHDRLVTAGVPIIQPPSRGPFGLQFSFSDPDGYTVTIHQPEP
jgi:predicted enzyme related to lactoylglutathione lyase